MDGEQATRAIDLADNSELDPNRLLVALTLLQASEEPVGARRLSEVLRSEGQDVAEATAGRLLRSLDEAGLTNAEGKRGRRLTPAGQDALIRLKLKYQAAGHSAQIVEAANPENIAALIDLLHVRRAIESEAARLAATRATPEELAEIAAAARNHVHCIETPGRVEQSMNFHMLIARASHNQMIEAVATLLLGVPNQNLADLLDRLLDSDSPAPSTVRDLAHDHMSLVKALQRRDAVKAERIMRDHIDQMIISAETRQRLLSD